MSALFGPPYRDRAAGLTINGSLPRRLWGPVFPGGPPAGKFEQRIAGIAETWGQGLGMEAYAPSQLQNPEVAAWWGKFTQMSASPGDAEDLMRMKIQIDIGGILPTIRVPTLVFHATQSKVAPFEAGRYFADHIPGARMLELDSIDHWPYFGDADLVLGEVEEFLTGARRTPAPETMLATVLCTNVAQAGAHARVLGGRQWPDLVGRHHWAGGKPIAGHW